MANPDHIWIIRQGNHAIHQWKSRYPHAGLDLFNADLRRDNLSDLDLSGADLRNADLRDANLKASDLSGAYLGQARLCRTNLSHAKLHKAELTGVNFTGAVLNNADLELAYLNQSNFSHADLKETNLAHAKLIEANFFNANLREADLSGADLRGANLKWSNLSGARLTAAELSHANLIETDLSDADLSDAVLTDAKLQQARFDNTTGYNLSHEQETENSKIIKSKFMGTGYFIILIAFVLFLSVVGLGSFFSARTDNPGLHTPPVTGGIALLAMAILVTGFLTGSVYIATEKGYSRELGFVITFLFIMTACFLMQTLLAEFIGVALLGPIVLALLADKNQRRSF